MNPALASTTIRFLVLLFVIKITTVTAASKETTPLKCQNGGISNGNRCNCPTFTEGTMCQNFKDMIDIGTTYEAKLSAELTVNHPYSDKLEDITSTEYKDFVSQYDELIKTLLEGYNGKSEYTLQSGTNGEVRVSNTITLLIPYSQTVEVKDQYEEMHRKVQAAITSNQCKTRALCIRSSSTNVVNSPPSKYERCSEQISADYLQFYKPYVSGSDLACVTSCAPGTPGFLDCNSGNCQIRGSEGPQCFCPRTDLYLYTYSKCQGAVSIAAMYGGVGASIGVLVIVGIVLGVFLYRKKFYN
ncbi:mucin-3A-like [Anomaloglossus baeobatrachus]|uniref:mucin-3A-like n=1 Tax=Anomaloglossus baeobatrachus TaxID=238106 RepID=UPI003F4F910E